MRTGTYTVVVRDRSRIHNAHLVGPGYNRATKPLTYTGSQTWKVKLAKVGHAALPLRPACPPGHEGLREDRSLGVRFAQDRNPRARIPIARDP